MKKLTTVVALAALATASVAASAGLDESKGSRGYAQPNGACVPGIFQPVALTEEQRQAFDAQQKAFFEQQKVFAEQQAKAFQQAMEAQKQFAGQYGANPHQFPTPFVGEPLAFDRPFGFDQDVMDVRHEDIRRLMEERHQGFAPAPAFSTADRDARIEEMRQQMDQRRQAFAGQRPSRPDVTERDARFEQLRKQMEERRKQFTTRLPFEQRTTDRDARHEAVVRQMEERRAEMLKRVEEQHAAMRRDSAYVPAPRDI